MCDICKSKNIDPKFINGDKYQVFNRRVYTLFKDRVVPVRLCFVHDVELFLLGERRFAEAYPQVVLNINSKRSKASSSSDSFAAELSNIAALI